MPKLQDLTLNAPQLADPNDTSNAAAFASRVVELITDIHTEVNDKGENTGIVYFGDRNTNGTWRVIATAGNLSVQLRTAGAWVEKFAFTP